MLNKLLSIFRKKKEQATYTPERIRPYQGQSRPGVLPASIISGYDYWALRAMSESLFASSHYAYGMVERVASELVGTGLELEYNPLSDIIGNLDSLEVQVEARFRMWGSQAETCDYKCNWSWAELQKIIVIEAAIAGDVLVLLKVSNGVAKVDIIPGNRVQSPLNPSEKNILNGVEYDKDGKEIAFHVVQKKGKTSRVLKRSRGGSQAILYSLKPRRLDQSRGLPILHLVEQSIGVISENRDAAQDKSLIASKLAVFVEKTEEKPGSAPISGAAVRVSRHGQAQETEDTQEREYGISSLLPGTVIETLQKGEKPHVFSDKELNTTFPDFEKTILTSICWYLQIPPTILEMKLSSNYSASQGEINMFNDSVERWRITLTNSLLKPVFARWYYVECLANRIKNEDFLRISRDPNRDYARYNAWINCSFHGSTMLTTDLFKTVRAYDLAVSKGWMTNDQASKRISGKKFDSNIKQLEKENRVKGTTLKIGEEDA